MLIADIVLVIHFLIVIFIVSTFFSVPIGYKLGWAWVSNTKIRAFHLGMMALITLETILGISCPLTSIEHYFRGIYHSRSFIGYWVGELIYWDFPTYIFAMVYGILLVWTVAMWKLYPTNKQNGLND